MYPSNHTIFKNSKIFFLIKIILILSNVTLPLIQRINKFTWLADVVNSLGGTPPQVQTMEHQQFKKLTISFEIPVREDLGTMIPIVANGKE
jgi:hypothetical protein